MCKNDDLKHRKSEAMKLLNSMESKCSNCGEIIKGAANFKKHKEACKKNYKQCLNERCDNNFWDSKERSFCSQNCFIDAFKKGEYEVANKLVSYRTLCFEYHEHKCIFCEENNILDVHHLDEDHNHNTPANLVPVCPTHHRYIHHKDFKQGYYNTAIDYLIDKEFLCPVEKK